MSVYARFKKNPDGLRALVELLETTPRTRRERMLQVGMQEDPEYTQIAVSFTFTFEDVLKLPEMELAEVLAKSQARTIGYAISAQPEEVKTRFIRTAPQKIMGELKTFLIEKIPLSAIGAAQLKMIENARMAEKTGLIHTKRIPLRVA